MRNGTLQRQYIHGKGKVGGASVSSDVIRRMGRHANGAMMPPMIMPPLVRWHLLQGGLLSHRNPSGTHSFAAARGGIGQPRAALEKPRDAVGGAADDGGDGDGGGGGAAASAGADGEFFDAMDYDDGGFEGRASCYSEHCGLSRQGKGSHVAHVYCICIAAAQSWLPLMSKLCSVFTYRWRR